jgi:hypothetical protein
MIRPEQLTDALARLDPRDGELLTLSLKRRVPDEALARMYGIDPSELVRRRTAAIERLADELGIESGEELGEALEALAGASPPASATPAPAGPPSAAQAVAPASAAAASAPAPQGRRSPHLALALAGLGIAALIGAAALASGALLGGDDAAGTERATAGGDPAFVPDEDAPPLEQLPAEREPSPPATEREPASPAAGREPASPTDGRQPSSPAADRRREATCYSTAYVRRAVTLYRRPGGGARVRLAARTTWKSPRVLGVVRRRGGWLAVQAPELRNGEVGWLPAEQAQLDCVRWSLHADLSKRRLHVRWDGRLVRRYAVAVGSPDHPTPRGRFSVTDKLRVTGGGSPYGCCVLALTGHQLRLPAGWPGGDRLAVHATNDLSSIGKPVSLGCMRTDSSRARWLIETIPLGAPIFIRS